MNNLYILLLLSIINLFFSNLYVFTFFFIFDNKIKKNKYK